VQEAYEVLSNQQERAYYDDNREQVLMSDDEDEDEKQAAEVAAEFDFYKWASRDAFVDFSHGATPPTPTVTPTPQRPSPLTPKPVAWMWISGGRLLLSLRRRLPQAA
jgi:DnaJ-class molecular chaperone